MLCRSSIVGLWGWKGCDQNAVTAGCCSDAPVMLIKVNCGKKMTSVKLFEEEFYFRIVGQVLLEAAK